MAGEVQGHRLEFSVALFFFRGDIGFHKQTDR